MYRRPLTPPALAPGQRPTRMVRPDWGTVVCVASGPSLTEAQTEFVAAARAADLCRVIVVNDNWRRVGNADVLYAGDGRWWKHNYADLALGGFRGELWTQDYGAAKCYNLQPLRARVMNGLSNRENEINTGGSSGYAALGLAYLFGATRIVLIGYDMKVGPTGELHWFGRHKVKELDRGGPSTLKRWSERFRPLAADLKASGVSVVNSTIDTALDCFPLAPIDRALLPLQ